MPKTLNKPPGKGNAYPKARLAPDSLWFRSCQCVQLLLWVSLLLEGEGAGIGVVQFQSPNQSPQLHF